MFGSILEYLYVSSQNGTGDISKSKLSVSITNNNTDDYWVCFLPESILRLEFIKRKIVSSRCTEVYAIPKTTIQPNPVLTRDVLERITEKTINREFRRDRRINLLGISLGNTLAYRFANVFSVDRFVSVVPGSFLPECIWESIATRRIAENSGYALGDYRNALDDFSPVRNLDNLRANSIEIHLGCFDRMIPYSRGKELVEEMKKRGLNPKITTYPVSGHCEAIFYFARSFQQKRLK